MYDFVLPLHNIVRWLVLLAAIWVLFKSFQGLQAKTYRPSDLAAGRVFVSAMDVQLLLGILLMFTSPLVQGAFANFSAAIQARELRFFTVEHTVVMLAAVALAHVGNTRVKKAVEATAKHRQALIWYGFSTLAILLAIPWWRPLLRF